jgi:A/G-specific adenine glycosylase
MPRTATIPHTFADELIAWYARGHRAMPWRDEAATPYHIWLAETMLQQTTVAAVIPYYHRFLQRFPTLTSLASAPLEDVLHLWQGLGYYRRAHLLHRCAQHIVAHCGGTFPSTEAELLALPGLGPYTAAVMAATAFNQPANVVDGNVERVISRIFALEDPLPAAKKQIRAHAATLTSPSQPRLYANAIMEFGSQLCTPQNPACLTCPVSRFCKALQSPQGPTFFPVKTAKKESPHIIATAWLITDPTGKIYLQQRPATGLLANLWELPNSGFEPKGPHNRTSPLPLAATQECGTITHTFTHFKLTLEVLHAEVPHIPTAHAFAADALPPLSTLMKKALNQGLSHI